MKIVVHKDASIQTKSHESSDDSTDYVSKIYVPGDVIAVEDVTDAVLDEIKAGRCPHLVLVDEDDVHKESVAAKASDLRNGDVVVSETVATPEEHAVAVEALAAAQTEVIDLGGADVVVSK